MQKSKSSTMRGQSDSGPPWKPEGADPDELRAERWRQMKLMRLKAAIGERTYRVSAFDVADAWIDYALVR